MLCKLKRLRSCGSEFLFKRLKRNQKIAGDNAENVLFSMAFSPDLLFTEVVGGGWGFRWAAKSAKSTATLHPEQKSRAFYGSNMLRPPGPCKDRNRSVFRCVARRHRPFCQPSNEDFAVEAVGPPYMAAALSSCTQTTCLPLWGRWPKGPERAQKCLDVRTSWLRRRFSPSQPQSADWGSSPQGEPWNGGFRLIFHTGR